VGIDVHRASMATLARAVTDAGLGNVRLHLGDGVEFLHRRIDVESLQLLQLLFPDPWPKNAHRARRLVQPAFAALAAGRLAPGGRIELATDRADYARQMEAVLGGCHRLRGGPCPRADRPFTFYERTAQDAGRPVVHLSFTAGEGAGAPRLG
jgi:tRNA (guanine-N7-)-methyltransferase